MIEFLRAAEEELLDAVGWYEDQQEGLGARFLTEVEKASDRIAERPRIGPVWIYSEVPEGARRLSLRTFPYHLVYVEDPRLVIVAVAHMENISRTNGSSSKKAHPTVSRPWKRFWRPRISGTARDYLPQCRASLRTCI